MFTQDLKERFAAVILDWSRMLPVIKLHAT